ncbi:unnamed protein product [Cyprideis torosa]|uniref:Uncharacterized protein n=1 Tax=Cyprideis torosa TaxID=163714 RepID=A0A7R8W581_9CRUS|nr:unnamed protein product [Cyprideis torosa]CAG0884978.1 unnamed protein product [Cyprideis torosa]
MAEQVNPSGNPETNNPCEGPEVCRTCERIHGKDEPSPDDKTNPTPEQDTKAAEGAAAGEEAKIETIPP